MKMNLSQFRFVSFALATVMTAAGCAHFRSPAASSSGASSGPYAGHGASSVDEKLVQKYAPPPLPPGTSAFVRNLLETQTPGVGMIAPGEKKSLFFTWNITGTTQVWKLDNPMAFPIQMTSGSYATTIADITTDGKYVVVNRDHAGEENPGLYLLPTAGGPLIEVFHKAGVRAYYAWSTADAETIFYTTNDIKPDSYALYGYSVATQKRELLFSEPGLWSVADAWGDRIFLLEKSKGSLASEFWVFEIGKEGVIPVVGQNEMADYQVMFGNRPEEFFILTNKLSEFKKLYYGKEGKLSAMTIDENNDIENFMVDHMRFRIYLHRNIGGRKKLEVLNTKTFDQVKFPTFEDADQVTAAGTSRLGRYAFISVDRSTAPRANYVYDWSGDKLTQWMKTGLPEVDATKFRAPTLESYPARDGKQIPMIVTRPAKCAGDPCPVVVHFHGGPESQSRIGFNRTAQIFAAAGFIFVEPNVRGSNGYGKSYLAADDGAKRLNVITDIEDASKYIRSAWAKNGKAPKVGVMGWSYGGYSTLMAMSEFAGAYDAGVAIVGMSNLRSFLLNTAPYRRALRISEYGDPEKDKEALEKLSATSYLDRVKGPLMIIQGLSDPRVPAGEAIQMHDLLEKRGIQAPLILFPNEGHGSRSRDNQVQEIGHTLFFFQTHLK